MLRARGAALPESACSVSLIGRYYKTAPRAKLAPNVILNEKHETRARETYDL